MALQIAKYQFQSWARRGIAAHITEPDTLGQPGAVLPPAERASVAIGVSINGAPQPPKVFELVGPGDIQGLMRQMVVRTEPRPRVASFEPNYLAFVEFYDEDFPWRYTPARPRGERLRPWIALVVLAEDEVARDDRRVPLPVITVRTPQLLPPSDESWLFAHVHTERDIPGSELSNLEQYLRNLREAVETDPDRIYSRLLSPRHLAPNATYHAFVVPAFEVGRLAGLGKPTAGVPAQRPAWDTTTTGLELPVYYEWEFRTGERQDFESLVRLLKPVVLDASVGRRDMDCSRPQFVAVDGRGVPKLTATGEDQTLPAALPATQGLEGALKTPRTESLPATYTPNAFQDELQTLVNLPETVRADAAADSGTDDEETNFQRDPVVSVPFYGQNHVRQRRTDTVLLDAAATATGWHHELNRDPRTRVPAGVGTLVVQRGQERFVQKAWEQVQKVYDANRAMRFTQFNVQVAVQLHAQVFARLTPPLLLAATRAVHAKVMGSPTTVFHQARESRLVVPVFSAPFRRLVRPAGKLAQQLSAHTGGFDRGAVIASVNDGRVSPAPPRGVPPDLASVDNLADRIGGDDSSPGLQWLVDNRWWLLAAVLALAVLLGVATGAWLVAAVVAVAAIGGAVAAQRRAERAAERRETAGIVLDAAAAATALRGRPPQPAFAVELDDRLAATSPVGLPQPPPPAAPTPAAPPPAADASTAADSADALAFRRSALDVQERLQVRAAPPVERAAFDMNRAGQTLLRAIDPRVSFLKRVSALVQLPGRQLAAPTDLVDAMAHPDIDDAMYAPLRDVNKEFLIPNLQRIPVNSVSLLETNPPFIEAFMVGVNHEMGRELLWREYPTDLRGSYFRQFWEVKGVDNPDTPAAAGARKDIVPIHTWPAGSRLGTHKPALPRADVPPGGKHVVLAIRGELLKRYPNTVVYAQKAIDDGHGNRVVREEDLTPQQFDAELKFPMFRAEVDPDVRLFGFDLTAGQARGTEPTLDFPNDARGWFFVIQEVPGEPRFGMDLAYAPPRDANGQPRPNTWNDLAWNVFGATEPPFVTGKIAPDFPQGSDAAEIASHPWGAHAAVMAYALFQTPAMVAVHAEELLLEDASS
jgi:hypothetical protein